jgi:hypothetical protein
LVFELIWKYRFLYRDINDLLSRNRTLEIHFKQILAHKAKTAAAICEGLVAQGEMSATRAEIQAMVDNMVVVATYWLSFEYVRNPRHLNESDALANGVFHVMALSAPFLTGRARQLFEDLARRYIEQ